MYRCSVESSIYVTGIGGLTSSYVTGIGALTSEECAGGERVNSTNHHLDPLDSLTFTVTVGSDPSIQAGSGLRCGRYRGPPCYWLSIHWFESLMCATLVCALEVGALFAVYASFAGS